MSNKFILTATAFLLGTSMGIADVPKVAVDIAPVHSLVSKVMTGVGKPDLIIPIKAIKRRVLRKRKSCFLGGKRFDSLVGEGLV